MRDEIYKFHARRTHIKAPFHLFDQRKTIDEYSIGTWIGRGIVYEVDVGSLDEITYEDVTHIVDDVQPRDALIFKTGWDDHLNADRYFEPPYLSREATEWIVESDVSWIGVDSPSPEKLPSKRGENFDFSGPQYVIRTQCRYR